MTTQIVTAVWPLVVPGGLPCELADRPTYGPHICTVGADFMVGTTVDASGELFMDPAQAVCEGHLIRAIYLAHHPHEVEPEDVAPAGGHVTVTTTDPDYSVPHVRADHPRGAVCTLCTDAVLPGVVRVTSEPRRVQLNMELPCLYGCGAPAGQPCSPSCLGSAIPLVATR